MKSRSSRNFDPEHAVAVAQGLFHAKGYDAVSVADVTDARHQPAELLQRVR